MANEILILPDIHGRDFWRDAVSARDFSEIVFNVHMFKLAHEAEVAGKKFLFTHAGVNADWLQRHADVVSEARAAALNDILPEHIMVLDEASYRRGGNQPTGSIIWADVNEMKESPLETDFYQIFGHSQQVQDPVITEHWACLDCRRPFIINGDGEIEDLTL